MGDVKYTTRDIKPNHKQLLFDNRKIIADLYLDESGFWVFHNQPEDGTWSGESLVEIGNLIIALNKPWQDQIDNYFDNRDEDELNIDLNWEEDDLNDK